MTNYEKIIAMSVEEMAKGLDKMIIDCAMCRCPAEKICEEDWKDYTTRSRSCLDNYKNWLESEVEEDG